MSPISKKINYQHKNGVKNYYYNRNHKFIKTKLKKKISIKY